jgi:outer membrane protein OmpA-like peptidoglycan-associated protein
MFWNNSEEEHNYWISYTDLVMGLLMAFIVVSMVLFSRDSEQAALDGKYRELFEVFQNAFGEMEGIQVTDDATITFVLNDTSEKELFPTGDHHPTEYMQQLLKDFIPVYYNELYKIYNNSNDTFNIKEIRVEGHTDSEHSYYANLRLSSRRAGKIQDYIYWDTTFNAYPNDFQEYVLRNSIVCGYSYTRLLDEDGNYVFETGNPEDKDRSRRVEFRTILEYKK